MRIAGRWINNQWSVVLCRSTLFASQIGDHGRLMLARGSGVPPALSAQTDQTMVLYHVDARSYLRTRAKHLLSAANAISFSSLPASACWRTFRGWKELSHKRKPYGELQPPTT